jgi:hypothetical protein
MKSFILTDDSTQTNLFPTKNTGLALITAITLDPAIIETTDPNILIPSTTAAIKIYTGSAKNHTINYGSIPRKNKSLRNKAFDIETEPSSLRR